MWMIQLTKICIVSKSKILAMSDITSKKNFESKIGTSSFSKKFIPLFATHKTSFFLVGTILQLWDFSLIMHSLHIYYVPYVDLYLYLE
jgi:hypothetical protein